MREDSLIRRIHEGHQAAVLMEVGSIHDQMLEGAQVIQFWRRLLEPVILDPLELGDAVAREIRELVDGILFRNPKFEPMPFIVSFDMRFLPNKYFLTATAMESLFVVCGSSILLDSRILAMRTPRTTFFDSLFEFLIRTGLYNSIYNIS